MSTNSADPTQLTGFAQSLDGPASATTAVLRRAVLAEQAYRQACPDLPVETPVAGAATEALSQLRGLLGGTRRIANAFIAADAGPGPDGIRRTDDAGLARALGSIVERSGDVEVEPGLITERGASWTLDQNGLSGELVGAVLLGARVTGTHEIRIGPVEARHRVEASIGAMAEGRASGSIGPDGVHVAAEAEAFAGSKVEYENEVTIGSCTASSGVTAAVGLGLQGEMEADLGDGGFTIAGSVLAVPLAGGGASGALSCSVPDVRRWAEDRRDDAEELWEWTGDRVVDGTAWGFDRVHDTFDIAEGYRRDAERWVDDRWDDAEDWVSDRTDDVGDVVEGSKRWVGDRAADAGGAAAGVVRGVAGLLD